MAIAPDQTDNFDDLLTCTICLETFTGPKYLPCLHTFCTACINTYILSTAGKEKTKTSFKCPICRQDVLMAKSTANPETWAEKLPGNHFVASMMDRQAIRRSEKICDSCKANNESKNALSWCVVCEEAFCESCEKCHKSFKISAKHPIVLLKDIGTNKEPVIISSLIYCEEHSGEVIKAYCVDHSKPLCTLCATLSHRKCEDVITIEKAASGIKKSEKAIELSTELKETNKQLSDLIQSRKDLTTDFEKETEGLLTTISTIKDNIIKHLNKIENQIEDEIKSLKKEAGLKLSEQLQTLESLKSTVNNWTTIFDTCLQHGSEVQCLLELNRIYENKVKFGDAFTRGKSEMKNVSMLLETNDIAEKFAERVAAIGVVKLVETNASCPKLFIGKNVNLHSGNLNVIQVIDLTGPNVYLSGLFMKDTYVFTHSISSKVLKYSYNGNRLTELKLPNHPYDIDLMNDTTAAVSSKSNTFYIINTNELTLCRKIVNTVQVHGFCYVNGEFILAYNNTLSWINSSTAFKNEQTRTDGDTYYIYAQNRKDYICADGSNTVSRMVNNTKVFTYISDKLVNPRGIDIDCDGNVYICGHGSGNIHQLSNDGKLVRIIPAESIGLKHPWVIRFKKNSYQFFVTCYATGKVAVCEFV
ncbi:tripartite motif-containing protein 56 [Mytilus galloprovincialis]|uniref:Tripartite motif-containing protein 56 n=1 Tax=Mytilus galloprovincialis TaxID=29158 RepID=A0A8B6CDA5_MYTGA|nr:tripartite motif-containing protein 56 [Mytilus galloprovincialis]